MNSLIALSLVVSPLAAVPCEPVLNYAQNQLPHQGVLQHNGKFIYVDVDDAYIHQLLPFLESEGFVEPPYFGSPGLVGAHISVVYPDEVEQYGLTEIEECGIAIPFEIIDCEVVHPAKLNAKEVYFLRVEAPLLDQLRAKYGLPKRQYDFHITIGIK